MKEIIHRLLLFITWAITLLAETTIYFSRSSSDEHFITTLVSNYQAFLIPIAVALGISLCINWIMTGNMHNWAGKIWDN